MAESVSVSNMPDSGSKHRVAFDLMQRIARAEFYERGSKDPDNSREYFLELYAACRKEVF